jgi:uncharacterized protein
MEPVAGILIGLAGALHCIGMCGPIALALPRTQERASHFVLGRLLYQFGRITIYTLMGLLVGLGASTLALSGYERLVSISAGTLMIVAAIMQLLWHRSLLPSGWLVTITTPVRTSMRSMLQKRTLTSMPLLGALNGLLPCGLVMAALFGSASTLSAIDGALFMFFFGLGTLPVMMVLALSIGSISTILTGRWKMAMPFIALALGALFILRGMELGIPYVSPGPAAHVHHGDCR